MSHSLTVGLIQMACSFDPRENLRRALERVEEAALAGAQILCLPELFLTPYFCQKEDASFFDLAEPIPGPSTKALGAVARKARVVVIVPLFEKRAPGLYHNSAAVIDTDGEVVGLYRKMHIPDDPGYYEKFYFTPGDLGFRTFTTQRGHLAVQICWDQWYPEAARLAALQGASMLFYPSAIGWHPQEKETLGPTQQDAWLTVQRAHAIANGFYVAAVNRTGHEVLPGSGPGIEFWGSSFLCDPQGVVVARAPADREALLLGEVCLKTIEEVRRGWPFLRDRRTDAYGGLEKRYLDPQKP